MIILLDMDGPLADFEGEFLTRWKNRHPELPYIKKEDRNTFYVIDQYPEEYKVQVKKIYTESGFIESLPVISGVIEFIHEVSQLGHDVFICSSPLSKYDPNVVEKYRWIEKKLGKDFVRKIILTKDKTLIRGDFLIDDNVQVKGILSPSWKRVVFDTPYNKHLTDLPRIKKDWSNWKEILLK